MPQLTYCIIWCTGKTGSQMNCRSQLEACLTFPTMPQVPCTLTVFFEQVTVAAVLRHPIPVHVQLSTGTRHRRATCRRRRSGSQPGASSEISARSHSPAAAHREKRSTKAAPGRYQVEPGSAYHQKPTGGAAGGQRSFPLSQKGALCTAPVRMSTTCNAMSPCCNP